MTEPLTLAQRLREADANSQQRVLGSRIFKEAADELDRLRDANKALTAENAELRMQDDPCFTYAFQLRARDAEAKLAKAEAIEAELHDTVRYLKTERDDAVRWRASAVACADRLEAELAEARAETKKQMHRATNAEYMARAYRNMLGPAGVMVAKMWDKKNVKRVHFDWGPDASNLDGEQRAQFILDWENAPSREMLPGEIDGDDFLASKEASHGAE